MTNPPSGGLSSGGDGLLAGYSLGAAFDEMFDRSLNARTHYEPLLRRLQNLTPEEFRRRKTMTDLSMRQDGVRHRSFPILPSIASEPRFSSNAACRSSGFLYCR